MGLGSAAVPPTAAAPIHSAAAQVLETAMRRFESTRDVSAPHLALRVGLYAHAAEPVYFKHRMPVFAVIVPSLAPSLAPLPPLPFLASLGQRHVSERRAASQQHMHPSLPVVLPRCAHSTTPAAADSTPAGRTQRRVLCSSALSGLSSVPVSTCGRSSGSPKKIRRLRPPAQRVSWVPAADAPPITQLLISGDYRLRSAPRTASGCP